MPESVGYPDLHEHLQKLEEEGLLITINEPVNKDTELHPLVRWQFRGVFRNKRERLLNLQT